MDISWTGVNWLAVIVAAVVDFVLGFAWYSRALFGRRWATLAGINLEQMSGGGASPIYAVPAVRALVSAYVLALLALGLGASTLLDGALLGLLVSLGFVVASTVDDYVFTGRPRDLWVLNSGYHVVGFVVMGAIIGLLQ
jgi:hypothetical protein